MNEKKSKSPLFVNRFVDKLWYKKKSCVRVFSEPQGQESDDQAERGQMNLMHVDTLIGSKINNIK